MKEFLWWRDGVIYQIYPRSFADTTNNGLGDLPGITAKLDYLQELGVDALWLSPIYPSPDKDFGYDVSDYVDIDPRFGSLADFDLLLSEAHRRGIRIILDLVLNHTSDQHAWFLESRASRDNPKADWYLWEDKIPNNWQSVFGGRAWQHVSERDQYYYHMFLSEQPDVNWRNPDVRAAMMDVLRFWLDRGVDGFRLDVFNVYFKDDQLRSNPLKLGRRPFDQQHHIYDTDRPELVGVLQEMREILDGYDERYAVGETFFATREKLLNYTGDDKLHAAFNFDFTWSKFNPARLIKPVQDWEQIFSQHHRWPNYVLSNHDVPRTATRHTKDEDDARAKVMMALLLTLRGTPFLYYGEEIGMRDILLKRSQLLDPVGKRYWPFNKGRDGCRSPMQWNASENAGFSSVKPWLPVHPNHKKRNVENQQADPASMLNFTRQLIQLRKENPALQRGNFTLLTEQPKDVLAYLRSSEEQTILIALNFKNRPSELKNIPAGEWSLLHSSARTSAPKSEQSLSLAPHEVLLLKKA
ncbi:MAG: alpha-glucosidase family protein [Anaerolineales bacterium]